MKFKQIAALTLAAVTAFSFTPVNGLGGVIGVPSVVKAGVDYTRTAVTRSTEGSKNDYFVSGTTTTVYTYNGLMAALDYKGVDGNDVTAAQTRTVVTLPKGPGQSTQMDIPAGKQEEMLLIILLPSMTMSRSI